MTEAKTWKDLAHSMEEPYELLEVDPARWDPNGTQMRIERVVNALVDLYRQYAENQKKIHDLGVKSGDTYKMLRGEQILVEGKLEALKVKLKALDKRSYMKNQEYQVQR